MKTIITISLLLLLTSMQSHAGRIYRFTDIDGVSTLSKTLPAYAAQKGYDILDDKSLRLIERIYTREELIEIQKQQAIIDLANEETQRRKDAERQRQLEKRINDRNLLARYPSIDVFTKSRDADLTYRQGQIDDIDEQFKNNKKKLTNLQIQAAEQEISGEEVSENLNKRLIATQKEIENNKLSIKHASIENRELVTQYESDLDRLKLLLDIQTVEKTDN